MQYTAEAQNEFRHRLHISLDEREVANGFARIYTDFSYRFPFEGFEAGDVPRSVIDEAFGPEAVAAQVGDALRTQAFGRAMGELDLVAIGEPQFSGRGEPADGQPYDFDAEIDCSPIFELSSYEPVSIKLPDMNRANPNLLATLKRMRETETLHALQERLLGEPPEIMCDAREEEQLQAVYAEANAINLPFDAYLVQQRIDPEKFKQELEEQATEMVRRDLALDAWAAHFGIQATDEQVAEGFAKSPLDYPAFAEAEWRATGRIAEVRRNIRRAAALQDVLSSVEIEFIS